MKTNVASQANLNYWLKSILNEKWIFYTLVLVNAWPLFSLQYFPTLDGPAHLYNSLLINEILFNDNSIVTEFFVLNISLLPNWIGHALLSLLRLFLPGHFAEMVLVIGFFILLPILFRRLVKTINPSNTYLCFLILPFTYNFIFMLGFFNYSLALLLMMVVLNYWIRNKDKEHSIKTKITLFLMFTCLYFSHIIVFVMSLFVLVIYVVIPLPKKTNRKDSFKRSLTQNHLKSLVITASIPLILSIFFIFEQNAMSGFNSSNLNQLLYELFTFQLLIVFDSILERPYTLTLSITILLLLLSRIYIRINHPPKNSEYDVWITISLLFLLLYFIAPNYSGSGGYYSVRLLILFYFFLILWLNFQKGYKKLDLLLAVPFLVASYQLSEFKVLKMDGHEKLARSISDVSQLIEKNAVIWPINNTNNWYYGHISNYVGAGTSFIILENYEAITNYFPIKWVDGFMPSDAFTPNNNSPYFTLKHNKESILNGWPIDYILVLGSLQRHNISDGRKEKAIKMDYSLIEKNEHIELYRLK